MNANIITNYRDQNSLRHSFNTLAGKTFEGLDFEAWYQNGYWSDHYNPYSIVIDGEVAANVSVNTIDFIWNGERKHFIQLGTVMTEERFRNQGLIRQIMNKIDLDYGQTTDGIYLFASDSVLDFYPKFGFKKAVEYQYTKPFSTSQACSMVQIPMRDQKSSKLDYEIRFANSKKRSNFLYNKRDWRMLENAMRQSVSYSRFNMVDNDYLIMFYVTGFMQNNVYYNQKYDAYVIAEIENNTLTVHNIFAKNQYPMDDIFASFGSEIRQVILGFTPIDTDGFNVSAFREEDCTLFLKGNGFDGFEQDKLIFPTLSHA